MNTYTRRDTSSRSTTVAELRIICDCQRHRRKRARLKTAIRSTVWGSVLFVAAGVFVSPLGASIPSVDVFLDNARNWIAGTTASDPTTIRVRTPARQHWMTTSMTTDLVREAFFKTQVPYGEIILKESERNQLPPELVAAVVKTESDFRPRLVSNKNALGLMQIIPSTGEFMGARDLFNPHDNIRTGTRYLRYLYDLYEGNRTMTLAAYNGGPGNVQKYGGVPPFTETRNYVVKVGRSNTEYEKRIRESAARWDRLALRLRD